MHDRCKKGQRNVVAAALLEVFNPKDLNDVRERSTSVIERLTPNGAKGGGASRRRRGGTCSPSTASRSAHWPKPRSTNDLERVNKEIARRLDVGMFLNDRSVICLVEALLIEPYD